jgi:hypothetical protein
LLLDLIINALEAMSAADAGPRELLISTAKVEGGGVLVAVQDSGPALEAATASERSFGNQCNDPRDHRAHARRSGEAWHFGLAGSKRIEKFLKANFRTYPLSFVMFANT